MTVNFPNLLRLDGRGIVLLGAGQGIGEATARALSQAGARVLCVDKEGDLASKIAREVDGEPCVADVTKRPDMERVFNQARSSFGAVRGIVDIVGMAKLAPLSAFTDADYEWQFDVGLRHAFLALQIGAPLVAEGGGGAITFVGSISGVACLPNEVVYSASSARYEWCISQMNVRHELKSLSMKSRMSPPWLKFGPSARTRRARISLSLA